MKRYDAMYSYAIEYAKYGFAVFPLKERDKTPLINHWNTEASTDAAKIKAWWQRYPNANIGIATGQISGGLYVIDCDCHNEGVNGFLALRDWQSTHGLIPPTWMAKTGSGGYHIFFTDTQEHKNKAGIIPGVDFRGDGGYIVAPPSVHPSGNRYEWSEKLSPELIALAEANDTLKYFLDHDNKQQKGMHYVAPEIIPQGERNFLLYRFACMMQAKGASDQTVFAATMSENETKCRPMLPEREVHAIVRSALKFEKGKPIYINSDMSATQGKREPIFKVNEKGIILQSWDNIREAIEFDEKLYSHIKYNELACSPWVYGELPWDTTDTYRPWKDSDDNSLKAYLEKRYGFKNGAKIMEALSIVLSANRFNPVTDELNQIYEKHKDDCDGCIRKLLPSYMGAEDSKYNYEVMKLYMLGAISRAFYPGCKFDYTLILYGAQGFGKSEFIRRLAIAPEWFNDNFNTFEGDKASEKLAGMWMVELAELKALKSAKDSESIKAFLTSRYDTYRGPWERRSTQRPRMCVFAGTTNNMNVFVDKTGNRRFLPIITRKGKETKCLFDDFEKVNLDFRKAWAEAMKLFHEANGNPELILPYEMQLEAEKMQEEFSEEDWRVGVIQNWLDKTDATKVCVPLVLEYALNMEPSKTTKAHQREILEILDNEIEGWIRLRNKDKGRTSFTKYGKQVAFIKDFV